MSIDVSFYEDYREQDENLVVRREGDYAFPLHYHINIEILVVKSGSYQVFCNGKTYQIGAGHVAFFDSYDVHGYGLTGFETKEDVLIIIPFSYTERFNGFRKKMKVLTPIISDRDLVDDLLDIVNRFLSKSQPQEVKVSAIDMILSLVEQKLLYSEKGDSGDTLLVKKILMYIEKNFKSDVSLTVLSKSLGYTKEHLSRTFNKCLRQTIPSYVNRLRLQYIDNRLKKTNKTLNELIFEAGFNSVQTYYRCRKTN